MQKTVVITGSSSGIGEAAARYFHSKNWKVIATMRNPAGRSTSLHKLEGIDIQHCDVTDYNSITAIADYVKNNYGKIDVLVNNAGYAIYGPFEASTPEQIQKQYTTNVFGLMESVRAFLPMLREHGGTIVNIASMGGRIAFPFYQVYNSTKFAVEGFTEGLIYELRPFNIKVKLIEPGVIKTDFYGRSMDVIKKEGLDAYNKLIEKANAYYTKDGISATADKVAKKIYKAATSRTHRLRYSVGMDAKSLVFMHGLFGDGFIHSMLRSMICK